MNSSDHDPPSPGLNDTSNGTSVDDIGLTKNSASALNASSKGSIVTLSPYIPPDPSHKGFGSRKGLKKNLNYRNQNRVEILPGIYEPASYNKFLTLSFENNTLEDLDMFEIHREIVDSIGKKPKVSKQGDGSLLIEVSSPEESKKIQSITNIKGIQAKCVPHTSLNQCKGVIFSKDLLKYSEEKLKMEFESQSVVEVVRMKKRENGVLVPTPMLLITFDLLKLPSHIYAAWLKIPIRPYIPSPRRCFHCQKYGHVVTNCRRKTKNEPEICVICGENAHGECDNPPHCTNCRGDHAASSKTCKWYLYEREALALKTTERISLKEAKERIKPRYNSQLFSSIGAVKTASTTLIASQSMKMPQPTSQKMEVSLSNKRSLSEESLDLPTSKVLNTRRQRRCSSEAPSDGPVNGHATSGGQFSGPSSSGGQVSGPSSSEGAVSGPSSSGGAVSGPSSSGGAVSGPSSGGGAVSGPSSSGGPVSDPSTSGGQASCPSLSRGPVSGSLLAGGTTDPSAGGECLSGPTVTASSKLLGGSLTPSKTTSAFSQALVSACGKNNTLSPNPSNTNKNRVEKRKDGKPAEIPTTNNKTGTKPKCPIIDRPRGHSNSSNKNKSADKGSVRNN